MEKPQDLMKFHRTYSNVQLASRALHSLFFTGVENRPSSSRMERWNHRYTLQKKRSEDVLWQIQTNNTVVNSGISLCPCPCGHVLRGRTQPVFDKIRRRQQCGFTAGRSTIDAILILTLLSELLREFERRLNVAYLDIKAAFDCVNRIALWKALRSNGILLQLKVDLHQNTGARVRVGINCSNVSRRHLMLGKAAS